MIIPTVPAVAVLWMASSFASADLQTQNALQSLQTSVPALRVHTNQDGRVDRLYGVPFSRGDSPHAAAEAFLAQHAGVWGVKPADLSPSGRFDDGRHLQPLMPIRDQAGEVVGYKFTGVAYTQWVDGIPVWRTSLCLLARNNADHDVVLAAADLRNLNGFRPHALAADLVTIEHATALAQGLLGPAARVDHAPQVVVFAGVDATPADPTTAIVFEARIGTNANGETYQRRLFVVDPQRGTLLHDEDRILNCTPGPAASAAVASSGLGGLTGRIQSWAGDGWSAEECDPEADFGMPYATFSVDGQNVTADADGFFEVTGTIGDDVTLSSMVRGTYFIVNNQATADSTVNLTVSDGDDVTVGHNEDANEYTFAESDCYLHSNWVRDMVLASNPEFPVIANQTNWPVNVNIADSCNAFYDYSSINFYAAGGSCNNTGFGTIVHHEFGHHVVSCAGSGQGAYGEGYGDVLSVLMTFDPVLARGFYVGNCVSGIRNADNTCQYLASGCSSCGSAIHACGQLLSGVVYHTWESLLIDSPLSAGQIITDLCINSVLLHSGSDIDGSITIDFLTLDDDDGDIGNGTPHYSEIASGFGQHGLDAPQLNYLSMSLPDGVPTWVDPDGGTELQVRIEDDLSSYQSGTAVLFMGVDDLYDAIDLIDDGDGDFRAVFGESNCAEPVEFWFIAETVTGESQRLPDGAPGNQFLTISADGAPVIAFWDDCTTDPGWTVEGDATDGLWERGIPVGGNNRPQNDCDTEASFCWLTENSGGGGSDVDGGETILVSPQIDATGVASVSYCFWYRNIGGGGNVEDDIFKVDISDDNGATWTNILAVGPTGPDVTGQWATVEKAFANVPGFEVNDQFRIRFNASDLNETSRVEAAIDNIQMIALHCDPNDPDCPGDVDGDGDSDVDDLLGLINVWGTDDPNADLDGSGLVEVNDLLLLLSWFGAC